MYRKWPGVRLTFFPFPIVVLAIVTLAFRYPFLIAAALLLPQPSTLEDYGRLLPTGTLVASWMPTCILRKRPATT